MEYYTVPERKGKADDEAVQGANRKLEVQNQSEAFVDKHAFETYRLCPMLFFVLSLPPDTCLMLHAYSEKIYPKIHIYILQ